ncbi:MAG: hypothetical protein IKU24_00260 [Clostridia bacterium]|nr:hypothetical protein [Clostridia bacterium]
MKKTIIVCFFLLFLIVSFSCGKADVEKTQSHSQEETKTVEDFVETRDEKPVFSENDKAEKNEEIPSSSSVSTTVSTTKHEHHWLLFSLKEANCMSEGERVWSCDCGNIKKEKIEKAAHLFDDATCTKAPVCQRCGTKGEALKHNFSGPTCTLCQFVSGAPIFVLGCELSFDESASEIVKKLGTPDEVLMEGELKSLLYYKDYSRFTVIQTDNVGLWGVFTFDSAAFFQIGNNYIDQKNFTGQKDTQSDAEYMDADSCRIYGFHDRLGEGEIYALWMRYSECNYDFMLDLDVSQNYDIQSKISYQYVNALRAVSGLSELSWSEEAAKASYRYAEMMAIGNFFYHDNLYGARLNEEGIVWRSCGENISQGYTNALFVCDAYYNCQDHRNNILNAEFTHVGMGYFLKIDEFGPLAVMGAQTFYH